MSKPTHEQLLAAIALIEAAEAAADPAEVSAPADAPSATVAVADAPESQTGAETTAPDSHLSPVSGTLADVSTQPTAKVHGPHLQTIKGYLGPVWQKF